MIVSIVEKETEHEGTQKLLVRGTINEIATEISNIIKEILKRGFPVDVLITAVIDAIEDNRKR